MTDYGETLRRLREESVAREESERARIRDVFDSANPNRDIFEGASTMGDPITPQQVRDAIQRGIIDATPEEFEATLLGANPALADEVPVMTGASVIFGILNEKFREDDAPEALKSSSTSPLAEPEPGNASGLTNEHCSPQRDGAQASPPPGSVNGGGPSGSAMGLSQHDFELLCRISERLEMTPEGALQVAIHRLAGDVVPRYPPDDGDFSDEYWAWLSNQQAEPIDGPPLSSL